VPNVIDTCAEALGSWNASTSSAATMTIDLNPRIRDSSENFAIAEIRCVTVVPAFGFPYTSTEAPLWISQAE
jgi:hypothetical protein